MTLTLGSLATALEREGLLLRGSFEPAPDDGVPPLPDGRQPGWLALAGIAGSAFWPHVSASAEWHDGARDPLDRWSRRVGDALAAACGGLALYPFGGPPYRPFLRWAERAEGLPASPLGLRLHPEYGLWHSYRFAIALPARPPDAGASPAPAPDLCATCTDQPCLSACPVGAFDGRSYAVDNCLDALTAEPAPACRVSGCLARHACPVGTAWAYAPPHARHLMSAFIAAHRGV